jgi:hypothetical protein
MIDSNNVFSGRSMTLIRAIKKVALKQQGKLYDRPLPHEEQKMDRDCEDSYTDSGAGARFSVARAWHWREHQNLHSRDFFCFAMADDDTVYMIGRE